jgi:oligopeptide transport system substrate-binding protein
MTAIGSPATFIAPASGPAYSFVPPGIANYPGGDARTIRGLINRSAAPGGSRAFAPRRRLWSRQSAALRVLAPQHQRQPTCSCRRAEQLAGIAPWVTVELRGVETQVHYANLRAKNFDVGRRRLDRRFQRRQEPPRACWKRAPARRTIAGYSNPEYDRLMQRGDFEVDITRRGDLMSRAEQMACSTMRRSA